MKLSKYLRFDDFLLCQQTIDINFTTSLSISLGNYTRSSICFMYESETVKVKKKKRPKRVGERNIVQFSVTRVSRLRKAGPRRSTRFSCYPGRVMGTYARVQRARKCREEKRFRSNRLFSRGFSWPRKSLPSETIRRVDSDRYQRQS